MNADEQQIADFLKSKGLLPEEFTKEEKQNSKTPDFRVLKDNKLAFFCEVKSISADESVAWSTILDGISNKIHEAVKQFDAVNPHLTYPNVLAFVNHDESCKSNDLINAITGCELIGANNSIPLPFATKFSHGRIKEERLQVGLYIWKDKSGLYKLFNKSPKEHFISLCGFFGVDSKSLKNILGRR